MDREIDETMNNANGVMGGIAALGIFAPLFVFPAVLVLPVFNFFMVLLGLCIQDDLSLVVPQVLGWLGVGVVVLALPIYAMFKIGVKVLKAQVRGFKAFGFVLATIALMSFYYFVPYNLAHAFTPDQMVQMISSFKI